MSIKSILFFTLLFGFILFGFFYYETFTKYFPIHIGIKFFILILAICGIFFPHIMKKLKDGDDVDDIKKFIINKYQKKNG
jgi:hypothetical protein